MSEPSVSSVEQLLQKLNEPQTAAALGRLLDRIDGVERLVDQAEEISEQVPKLAATATDAFDETCRNAKASGIDLDQRIGLVLRLAERLTAPSTIEALEALLDRMDRIEALSAQLDQMPKFLAMIGDIFDEWAVRLNAQGIDLEKGLAQGVHAALWLGNRISERELDRLGIFLRSEVLEPHALAVVGKTGQALATSHENACRVEQPEQVGPMGLLKALNDPDVQRSLAFAVRVAKCFGATVARSEESAST